MGTRATLYPTLSQVRLMSNQELVDRGISGFNPALAGTADNRGKVLPRL